MPPVLSIISSLYKAVATARTVSASREPSQAGIFVRVENLVKDVNVVVNYPGLRRTVNCNCRYDSGLL